MNNLTKADQKFISEFIDPIPVRKDCREEPVAFNHFTGCSYMASPIVSKLVNFVQKLEQAQDNPFILAAINPNLKPSNWVQKFDRARMIILKLDPLVYSNVID